MFRCKVQLAPPAASAYSASLDMPDVVFFHAETPTTLKTDCTRLRDAASSIGPMPHSIIYFEPSRQRQSVSEVGLIFLDQ
jgi:hypothetical protein